MKVTYFGGPKDGEKEDVNPRLDVNPRERYLETGKGKYVLDVKTARYIWQDLKWPLT